MVADQGERQAPIAASGPAGVVLAGGKSSRMGRDKASLRWDDSDLLHTVLDRLAAVCPELIVVSNVPRALKRRGVLVVSDSYPGCGPLAGIHAGLLAMGAEYGFFAACDMPFLSSAAIARIVDAAAGWDAAVPYIDGYYHPLHAVYHKRCLPHIEQILAAGDYRVLSFYPQVRLRRISVDELRPADPDLRTLCNINTPEELATARLER